ncbi:MAG TPA: filamentous hemagglutinin N-terminal domain-containing protein, partial [bacterium]|nr:filamentous hemagglutinin N-terminal domain-containing protein [bacterium]
STLAAAVAAAFWSQGAVALPTGGVVTHGSSVISTPSATTMNINQTTGTSIIEWQTFNIAKPESVVITQPVGGSALYRIGAQSPSEIYGTLSASGSVILSNPAGVYFMPGASVDVKGLVATSLSITDASYLSGNWVFTNPGGAGAVVNQGTITAPSGYAVLAAPHVRNEGVIAARMGTVALAAGDQVRLDMVGDGLISVQVPTAALNAAAINKGTLAADGGTVLMTARSANAILDTVINTEGVIRADTIAERNGVIVLDGGEKGVVSVSGSLSAQGLDAGAKGGTVKVLGEYVGVGLDGATATINASGDAGGGTVLVGGNFGGRGPEANAYRTFLGHGAQILVDALGTGDGGRVIVWANDTTRASGLISARGGAYGGNGGFVEVSGKRNLAFAASVDTRSPNGVTGTLLLDPTNITVQDTVGADDGELGSGDGTFAFGDGTTGIISDEALEGVGATTNIVLQAANDITVSAGLSGGLTLAQTGANSVTFQAGNNITIASAMSTAGGAITLSANDPAGTQTGTGTVTISATGSLASGGGNIVITNNGSTTSLAFAESVNAGSGQVTLTATGAGISQTGGAITAGTLTGNSGGVVTLGQTNAITNLGAFTSSGGFTLADAGGLTVTGAVSDGTGLTSITTNGGNLVVNADVTGTGISLAATTSGNMTLNANVNAGANAVMLSAPAGTISQTAGTITANALGVEATAAPAPSLTTAGTLNTIAANITGAGNPFSFTQAATFDVGTVGSIVGVTTSNGAITLTASAGNLTMSQSVNSGAATTSLNSTAGLINQTGGTVTAGTLTGSAATSVNLGTVAATNLGAFSAGTTLTLVDAGGLNVTGAVGGGTGLTSITTDSGNLAITTGSVAGNGVTLVTTTSGNIALGGNVNAGAGTATLTSAGNISQSAGTLTAATLTGSSAGTTSLGTTALTNLGAFTSSGGFTLADAGGLTVTGAITDTAGPMSISTTGGALDLGAQTINNTGQTLTLSGLGVLQSTGTVLANAATVTSGTGAINLTSGTNDFSATVIATGTGISITDINAVTVALTDGANSTLNAGGNLAVSGTVAGNLSTTTTGTGTTSFGLTTVGGTLQVGSAGAVSQTGALTVAGAANINAGANPITLIHAANDFQGLVTLSNSGASNPVSIVDANDISFTTLVLGGDFTVTAQVGNGTITLSNVTNTGFQHYNGNVFMNSAYVTNGNSFAITGTTTVGSNSSITTGAGNVTLTGAVNSETGENNTLTINSSGTTTFGSTVGATQPLGALITDAGGTTVLGGNVTTTGGGMTFGDPVTVAAGSTLTTSGNIAGAFTTTGTLTLVANDVTGSIAAPTVNLTSNQNIINDLLITGVNSLTVQGAATEFTFASGSQTTPPSSLFKTSDLVLVGIEGAPGSWSASILQTQAGIQSQNAQSAIAAVVAGEAANTFGTDSV